MNLFISSFLCLDIGTSGVRGIAHRVKDAHIEKSAYFTIDSYDTVFAIKTVIDELEKQIGAHFDSAYITGDFGPSHFDMNIKNIVWSGEHKITASDIRNQISRITVPENYFPMHIIPLRYDTPNARNIVTPIGIIDRQLISVFSTISYSGAGLDKIHEHLRGAHIQPAAFYDPHFIYNVSFRTPKQTTMFIDFGARYTTASIWTDRGPVAYTKIEIGGTDITNEIRKNFNLDFEDAERIKKNVSSLIPKEMDRFTPADTSYEFSRSDINETIAPIFIDIIGKIHDNCESAFKKYRPAKIILTGGGAETDGLRDFVENAFAVIAETLPSDSSVRALSDFIWKNEQAHRQKFISRQQKISSVFSYIPKKLHRKKKPRQKFVPILPSTLCFDMSRPETYTMFKSGGISMIHVDIMDGFYVDKISGSIEELRKIRQQTNSHLHVHLMTESPNIWAQDAIDAGADTVILSTNTSGLRAAIRTVRSAGKRVGIALHPDSSVSLLKSVLRDIDEVMIMSVIPGAAGQSFIPDALHKISVLNATRKKYNLKFVISVDGGINNKTSQPCWDAGADMLVCGSYLARAHDFPLAVQSLLKTTQQQ